MQDKEKQQILTIKMLQLVNVLYFLKENDKWLTNSKHISQLFFCQFDWLVIETKKKFIKFYSDGWH